MQNYSKVWSQSRVAVYLADKIGEYKYVSIILHHKTGVQSGKEMTVILINIYLNNIIQITKQRHFNMCVYPTTTSNGEGLFNLFSHLNLHIQNLRDKGMISFPTCVNWLKKEFYRSIIVSFSCDTWWTGMLYTIHLKKYSFPESIFDDHRTNDR